MANSQKCLSFIIRLYIIKEMPVSLIEHLLRFHICRNVMKIPSRYEAPSSSPIYLNETSLLFPMWRFLPPSLFPLAVSIQRFKSLETTTINGILFSKHPQNLHPRNPSTVHPSGKMSLKYTGNVFFRLSMQTKYNESYSIHNYVSKYTPK